MAIAVLAVHANAMARPGEQVVTWGGNNGGSLTVSPDLSGWLSEIRGGYEHVVALRTNGTVVCWGSNGYRCCLPPAQLTRATKVDAGDWHSVALGVDGTVYAWGDQPSIPTGIGPCLDIAAGNNHTVVINRAGLVRCWGNNNRGQCEPPTGLPPANQVAAGVEFSLARYSDGLVRGWGRNLEGECDVPALVVAPRKIAAGNYHCIALHLDGSVTCWGDNNSGQCNIPASLGPVVDVDGGDVHTVALLADGTVRCWGSVADGRCDVPAGLLARRVAATYFGTIALADCTQVGDGSDCNADGSPDACAILNGAPDANGNGKPDSCDAPWSPTGTAGNAVEWTSTAAGAYGNHWFWLSDERVDLATAKQRARQLGGHLAVVTSQREWDFVRTLLGTTTADQAKTYWIGLERYIVGGSWQAVTGECFGAWAAPWGLNDDSNTVANVSYTGNFRSSRPTEQRRFLVEFDFADLNRNGIADSAEPSMNADCDGDGMRDSAQIAFSPDLDCNSDGTIDSCQTRRRDAYSDSEWSMPPAGEPAVQQLPVDGQTSSDIRVVVSAIGDLGEWFKGEYVDVNIEGLATIRAGGAECNWITAEATIPAASAAAVIADGSLAISITAGPDVDVGSCPQERVRVQVYYSLPTDVRDDNQNGRPDTCDPGWQPDVSNFPGIVQREPGHWYWLCQEARNFNDARARAAALGGQLLTITSDAEFEWIRDRMPIDLRWDLWLGMARPCGRPDIGAYQTITGEPMRFSPTWFYDYYDQANPCNFTAAAFRANGGFRSEYREVGRWFIVEFDFRDCDHNGRLDMFEVNDPATDIDADGVPDRCTAPSGPDCDGDGVIDSWAIAQGLVTDENVNGRPDSCDFSWTPSGEAASAVRWDRGMGDHHWYMLVWTAHNYARSPHYGEARELARRLGGHLATITSREEEYFIAKSVIGDQRLGSYWVGMERRYNETRTSDFRWVTGERLGIDPVWWANGNWSYDSAFFNTEVGYHSGNRDWEIAAIIEFDFRDADHDGHFDWKQMIDPAADCDGNGMLDTVQLAAGLDDCNANGVPDRCDVAAGAADRNFNGRPDSCDAGWTPAVDHPTARQLVRNQIGDRWYLISDERTGYEVAKQRAAAMGGHLLTITTATEHSFIRNELLAGRAEEFWIGMERAVQQCQLEQLRWITGEPSRFDLTFWYNGCWNRDAVRIAPDGRCRTAPHNESFRYIVEFDLADCNGNGAYDQSELLDVAKDRDANGLLDSCELALGYSDCDRNGIIDAADISAGATDANGNGRPDSCDFAWQPGGASSGAVRWVYGAGSAGGGRWFLATTDRVDLYTANELAHSMGGRLATVTSEAEWQFIRSIIALNPDRSYWVGIERPCWCCPWAPTSGETFAGWSPQWTLNDCNVGASVGITGGWRSSSPFEQRYFLVEFDFDDLDGDGTLDAGQSSQQSDCNQNGVRDAVEVLLTPEFDCNHNGRPDECDTARAPFTADQYANLPSAGEVLIVDLPVNSGTSSSVRIQVDAIGDLGEPYKGEWLDVDFEGMGSARLQGPQCGWATVQQTFSTDVASPKLVDGHLRIAVTVGPGVDITACGENRVRVRVWYSLPTLVDDLNQNGWPDSCEIGSQPPSSLEGVVQRAPQHWYWVSPDARSGSDAEAHARSLGGHLVSITSQAEWDFITTQLGLKPAMELWMGMRRQCGETSTDSFAWTTTETRVFERQWLSNEGYNCSFDLAVLRIAEGWGTGVGWWTYRYIVEFDYRDCNGNGRLDMFESPSSGPDCDGNGVLDGCQLSRETDCDDNGVLDSCQIASGAGDSDGNGVLDVCEQLFADINEDGVVNGADMALVLSAWAEIGKQAADLNRDGIVDGNDLGLVLANWSELPP
jgi:hypothetical protein